MKIREIVTEIDKITGARECGLLIPPSKGKTFHFYTGKYDGIINNDLVLFIIAKIFTQML